MMKLLEEYWYGNINPMGRPFQQQRKFDKIFKLLAKNEEEMLETLNDQEKELFGKYKECYDEMIQTTEYQHLLRNSNLKQGSLWNCLKIIPTYSMN